MGSLLPTIVASFAAVAIAVTLYTLWRSLRLALQAEGLPTQGAMQVHAEKRDALLEEKEILVRGLSELAFDRDVDKLSDDDFERLDKQLRARTKDVLRALDDDLGAHRKKAQALIAARLAELGPAPSKDEAKDPKPAGDPS